MSRICFVRHGATSWSGRRFCGRSDPVLSAVGRAQAATAAERLALMGFRATEIRTSPLRRARQTAERIAASVGGPVVLDRRLREIEFGAAEGLTYDAVQARWPDLAAWLLAADPEIDWPEGETAAAARARIAPVADDLRATDRDLIVVSHGGTIRSLAVLLAAARQPTAVELLPPGGIVVLDRRDVAGGSAWPR